MALRDISHLGHGTEGGQLSFFSKESSMWPSGCSLTGLSKEVSEEAWIPSDRLSWDSAAHLLLPCRCPTRRGACGLPPLCAGITGPLFLLAPSLFSSPPLIMQLLTHALVHICEPLCSGLSASPVLLFIIIQGRRWVVAQFLSHDDRLGIHYTQGLDNEFHGVTDAFCYSILPSAFGRKFKTMKCPHKCQFSELTLIPAYKFPRDFNAQKLHVSKRQKNLCVARYKNIHSTTAGGPSVLILPRV